MELTCLGPFLQATQDLGKIPDNTGGDMRLELDKWKTVENTRGYVHKCKQSLHPQPCLFCNSVILIQPTLFHASLTLIQPTHFLTLLTLAQPTLSHLTHLMLHCERLQILGPKPTVCF